MTPAAVEALKAKIFVPVASLLVGLLPSMFMVGRAYGSESTSTKATTSNLTSDVEDLKKKVAAESTDHDMLTRIDERVASIQRDLQDLKALREYIVRSLKRDAFLEAAGTGGSIK